MKDSEFLKQMDPTLTEDDLKVIKHLKAIDNIFKRGDLSIRNIFVNAGCLKVLKSYNGIDYSVSDFDYIICDGGDTDDFGENCIHSHREWMDLMDEQTCFGS